MLLPLPLPSPLPLPLPLPSPLRCRRRCRCRCRCRCLFHAVILSAAKDPCIRPCRCPSFCLSFRSEAEESASALVLNLQPAPTKGCPIFGAVSPRLRWERKPSPNQALALAVAVAVALAVAVAVAVAVALPSPLPLPLPLPLPVPRRHPERSEGPLYSPLPLPVLLLVIQERSGGICFRPCPKPSTRPDQGVPHLRRSLTAPKVGT